MLSKRNIKMRHFLRNVRQRQKGEDEKKKQIIKRKISIEGRKNVSRHSDGMTRQKCIRYAPTIYFIFIFFVPSSSLRAARHDESSLYYNTRIMIITIIINT